MAFKDDSDVRPRIVITDQKAFAFQFRPVDERLVGQAVAFGSATTRRLAAKARELKSGHLPASPSRWRRRSYPHGDEMSSL